MDPREVVSGVERYERRLREAHLRHAGARSEIVDYRTRRGLDRGLFERLYGGRWIAKGRNLILTGRYGVGKTRLCCALAQASYRREESALYRRTVRLLWELEVARGDGSYPRLFRNLSKAHFLVLDDFGPDPLTAEQRRDLMELVEERSGRVSTAILSQLPLSSWHDLIGEPTHATVILDRFVHSAYCLELDDPSLRGAAAAEGKDENPASPPGRRERWLRISQCGAVAARRQGYPSVRLRLRRCFGEVRELVYLPPWGSLVRVT